MHDDSERTNEQTPCEHNAVQKCTAIKLFFSLYSLIFKCQFLKSRKNKVSRSFRGTKNSVLCVVVKCQDAH